MSKNIKSRIWEIDFLRGVAVILMILYHVVFDLYFFFNVEIGNPFKGFWYYEGRISAILFILISGMISAMLLTKNGKERDGWHYLLRVSRILFFALLITFSTWLFDPSKTIVFGILHFLGVSALMTVFFRRFAKFNVILGLIFIFFSSQAKSLFFRFGSFYLIPFGIPPTYFQSFDYYPLLPWFGVILIGMGLQALIYQKPIFLIRRPNFFLVSFLEKCGKKSLFVYLLHQPVILAMLWIFF